MWIFLFVCFSVFPHKSPVYLIPHAVAADGNKKSQRRCAIGLSAADLHVCK